MVHCSIRWFKPSPIRASPSLSEAAGPNATDTCWRDVRLESTAAVELGKSELMRVSARMICYAPPSHGPLRIPLGRRDRSARCQRRMHDGEMVVRMYARQVYLRLAVGRERGAAVARKARGAGPRRARPQSLAVGVWGTSVRG